MAKTRTYEHFADRDQLGRLALERIPAGISTRNYRGWRKRSGDRGAGAVEVEVVLSRAFVQRTREALWRLMSPAARRCAVSGRDARRHRAQGPHEPVGSRTGSWGSIVVQRRASWNLVGLLDRAGRRQSPAMLSGSHQGRVPRNTGLRSLPDPPSVEEIIAVMRAAGPGARR